MSKIIDPFTLSDIANGQVEGLSLEGLNTFLEDVVDQPPFRNEMDVEADYYDSNQLTAAQVAENERRGLPPVTLNLIAPTINMVLGLEAKTRTDWRVRAEKDDVYRDFAEALSVKLHAAEKRSRADRACSDAYAGQIKVGVGWVEVSRASDPFAYPYRVRAVDRREIYWDWRSREPDLSDARFLMRRKWLDADHAAAVWPDQRELINYASRQWASFDPTRSTSGTALMRAQQLESYWGWDEYEWRDALRHRVCTYEIWYRVFARGHVLRLPDRRVVEFDRKNPAHQAAVYTGAVKPEPATIPKVRQAWFIGPHRISDTPVARRTFPYIPFWGFREDRTGVPYGMIRAMRPMQDEVNRRRAKMLWQLSSVRIKGDEDAVRDWGALANEVARPDAIVKLNPDRKNKDAGVNIDDHAGLNAQQFNLYVDSIRRVQDTAGIYGEQLGEGKTGQSGVAIASLVEQGNQVLGEINDNYRFSRRLVGEALLELVREDLVGQPEEVLLPARGGRAARRVKFNERVVDEATRIPYLNNDVERVMVHVDLDDVPSSPTYRQQVFQQMTEMVKGLPEQFQAPLVGMVVEASDFPGKDEAAGIIRQMTGQQPTDVSVLSKAEQEQFLAAQARAEKDVLIADTVTTLQVQKLAADVAQAEADAEKSHAEAAKARAEAGDAAAEEPVFHQGFDPMTQSAAQLPAGGEAPPTLSAEEFAAIEAELAGAEGQPSEQRLTVQGP